MIKYQLPTNWIFYRPEAIAGPLAEAHASIMSLSHTPFQRSWVEGLQQLELKREIAGTTRIEGAEFTDKELEAALKETTEQLHTRSQRQAHATHKTYKWIASIPDDRPIDESLIREIHRLVVTGADDDHCEPGILRKKDQNVTFGLPAHRGAEGGDVCEKAFSRLVLAIQREFRAHDKMIQAFAAHYHFAAIHPFADGNGRTARALEALLLRRAGLKETCFISMSNYYYDEKNTYLQILATTAQQKHDLTEFINFGLRGIARQSRHLLSEVKLQISKALFRNMMFDLFLRLKTPKKRVIAERQLEILKSLLDSESLSLDQIAEKTKEKYSSLKSPRHVLIRDLNNLIHLGAIVPTKENGRIHLRARLEWPTEITETEFFKQLESLPKAKTHPFLR